MHKRSSSVSRCGPRPVRARRSAGAAALVAAGAAGLIALAPTAATGATSRRAGAAAIGAPRLTTIFSGASLGVTQPDDLTLLGGKLFVAFQNGIGPQGQPSSTGVRASVVVEMTTSGVFVHNWSIVGHVDGLTADPADGLIVATTNEDASSSLSTIDPATGAVVHYRYAANPLPHNGGTDAISFWRGQMLISASAPGTLGGKKAAAPQASYPAVYRVTLIPATHMAQVSPIFFDEDSANVANSGPNQAKTVQLALTDPDSNEVVPAKSPRFGGDFVLDSQGDKEQIYLSPSGQLSVLELGQSIDDTAWTTAAQGSLYIADNADSIVDVLRGGFHPGTAFVAVTPCDANGAPATCPGPGFPADYLGKLDLQTGQISPVALGGLRVQPHGLVFVAG